MYFVKDGVRKLLIFCLILTLFVGLAMNSMAKAQGNPNTGSIWTTNLDCEKVNGNIYTLKGDVYLDGGPSTSSNPGLPDGEYFVKVTEPNDTLLGKSDPTTVNVSNGRFATCVNLFNLTNFSDTTNSGGEYKVWVSKNKEFPNNESKTDNFKVGSSSIASPKPIPNDSSPTPIPCVPDVEGTPCPTSTPAPTPTSEPTNPPAPGPQGPKVCDSKQPPAPLLLSVTRTSATTALLKWAPVIPSTYYVISYGTDPNNLQFGVPNTGNTDNFTVGALNPNLNYYFRLMAVNECMPSDPSAILGTGGGVLGASTSKVLGASTDRLAATHSDFSSLRAIAGLAVFGLVFVAGVQFLHAREEN
ncbi:MAG TPA: fibronectin type III domain-containing protein [Patescibacteria group bacterium]